MVSKFLKRSESTKNVGTLLLGTGIAQAILLLISPILTRLYSPGDFATLTMFTSVTAIVGVLATCRFEFAVVLPQEDTEASQIMRLAMTICFWVTLASLFIVTLYDLLVPPDNKSIHFSLIYYLAPVSIMLTGLYNTFNYWSTRKKTFSINSTARVSAASAYALVSSGAGFLKWNSSGLIFASIASQLVGVIMIGFQFIKNPALFFSGGTKGDLKKIFWKYRDFAFVNTPHALVDVMLESGFFLLMAYYFDAWVLGLYAFAFRLLKAPAGLIGTSLYQVLFQRMSEAKSNDVNLQPIVLRIYRNLFMLGIIPAIVGMLYSPQIFSFIFGKEWKGAGEMAQIIIPWIFLNLLVTSLSSMPLIRNKQRKAIVFALIDIVFRFSAIIIGGFFNSYRIAFIILSILCSLLMLYLLYWYYQLANYQNTGRSSPSNE